MTATDTPVQISDLMPVPRDPLTWASYSSTRTHGACAQKWHYSYLLGLEKLPDPTDAKVELNFGIWWHALRAADAIERGRRHGSLVITPRRISVPDGADQIDTKGDQLRFAVIASAGKWWDDLSDEHGGLWIEKLGEPLVPRLRALDQRWADRWGDELVHQYPVAVEAKWVRPVPGTNGVELLGYVDEVYRDVKRNLVVVVDHKTGKNISDRRAADDMMDSQTHLYAWGLAPQLEAAGLRVNAVSYDRVRSPKATEPKLNQSGTLSKTVTQFDLQTYLDWVAEGQEYPGRAKDGSQAGVYEAEQSVIDRISTPAWKAQWLDRTLVPLNVNLVREHLQAAADAMVDMATTDRRVRQRGSAARNPGDACRWCDFASLCLAQMLGGTRGVYPLGDFGLRARER